jgi:hypothetical protein
VNDASAASLHILESTNSIIKDSLAESGEKVKQIDRDFENAIRAFKENKPE